MFITDIFNSASIALNRTEVESNKIPFLGEQFFPARKKMSLDAKWIKQNIGLNTMLAPSNFDALPVIRSREGFQVITSEMAFFRESRRVNESDMMNITKAQDADDPFVLEALESVYDDANKLVDAADIAVEAMRMQLLATEDGTPKINIGAEDNTIYSYNYDNDGTYAANHYMKLTGTDTWDNVSTAKPLNDIREATKYLKSIGANPMYALMTSATFDYLLENEQMLNAFITISGAKVEFMDTDTGVELFRRKTGLTPVLYDKMYLDYTGTQQNFYPDNKVTIIGDSRLGYTLYGVTPEERTLIGDSSVDVTVLDRGVAITVKTEAGPPVRVVTSVSQLAIPTYEGMDGTYVINVKGE